jgi:hypothetical protein
MHFQKQHGGYRHAVFNNSRGKLVNKLVSPLVAYLVIPGYGPQPYILVLPKATELRRCNDSLNCPQPTCP